MFDPLYEFLAGIGYGHPLHPMFVHTASGVPTVALLLALAALLSGALTSPNRPATA